jgi:hypothetical protein
MTAGTPIPVEPCEHCVRGRRPLPPYTIEQLRAQDDAAVAALRVPTPAMARRLAEIEAGREQDAAR